jgi:hypothetical protein
MFENVKTSYKWSMAYHFVFLIRRLLFVVSVFYLRAFPTFQIIALLFTNLANGIYIGAMKPFKTRFLNNIEMINELQVTMICFHTIIFTDYVQTLDEQYNAGWIVIILVNVLLLTNIVIVLCSMFHNGSLFFTKYERRLVSKFVKDKKPKEKDIEELIEMEEVSSSKESSETSENETSSSED